MKKLIRLTESDLHRIVKESVNKILSEAINELDPRTYASYADKRRAQGQNDKAFKGTQAAANAWNKEYSKDYPNGRYWMSDYELGDENENRDWYDNAADSDELYSITSDDTDDGINQMYTYYPKKNISHDVIMSNDMPPHERLMQLTRPYEKGEGMLGALADTYNDFGNPKDRKGLDVAKQMAHGNGKYIKGKGWQ